MSNESLLELVDISEVVVEERRIVDDIAQAKTVVAEITKDLKYSKFKFEDDIWSFDSHLDKGKTMNIDFRRIISALGKKAKNSFIILVKCWIANVLSLSYPANAISRFYYLLFAIEITDFFEEGKVNDLTESLREGTFDVFAREPKDISRSNNSRAINIAHSTLSFLSYTELEVYNIYYRPLMDIKRDLPYRTIAKQLPKGKDILKLDYCIKSFFSNGLEEKERLYYAPILLWWKITNIIPMRISEFCKIKRECIFEEQGNNYIHLPRIKEPASNRRVQVIDTIEINAEIYSLIKNYIDKTELYGYSETLISFRALISLEYRNTSRTMKREKNYIDKQSFRSLLKSFYKRVVYSKYNLDVEQEVTPNDTRHFAFCSLLMQGYSPIEIARLGGHSTIEAQYHYSNHTEYFVDLEVNKLLNSFKRIGNKIENTSLSGHEIKYRDIEKKIFSFPDLSTNTKLPMEIGFCTDEKQRCQSEECLLCDHWWIHPEELINNKPLIERKIMDKRKKVLELGYVLDNLNKSITTQMMEDKEIHQTFYNKLQTNANVIRSTLEEIARLEMINGGHNIGKE